MSTGGSLSRTGVSVGAGATGRLGGVFAGLWLGLIVLLFGSYAEKVPLAVIGLQQLVHLDDGGWETQGAPKTLPANQATVLVVQGLDFFAEVPALDDQMPSARGVSNAVVILVARDMHHITSTAIKWLEHYAQNLKAEGSVLMLVDVDPKVIVKLQKSGALETLGSDYVFPATKRVLAAENSA
jgi:MFS superfamily sulfate permease-like transporter